MKTSLLDNDGFQRVTGKRRQGSQTTGLTFKGPNPDRRALGSGFRSVSTRIMAASGQQHQKQVVNSKKVKGERATGR